MAFNFDQWVDRSHSDSVKWDKYRDRDIIPLWVADSDFTSPPAVIEALQRRVAHGVFGYTQPSPDLIEVFTRRMVERYGWHIKPEWIIFLHGLVCGLNLCVRACTEEHQSTLAPSPIYPPFRKAAKFAGRKHLSVPLTAVGQRWVLDFPRCVIGLAATRSSCCCATRRIPVAPFIAGMSCCSTISSLANTI